MSFWAASLDPTQGGAAQITAATTCTAPTATVVGGQVAGRPTTAIDACPVGSYYKPDEYCYACPVGSYCPGPGGTAQSGPVGPCPPDQYNPYLGQSACLTCPVVDPPYTSYSGATSCNVKALDKDCIPSRYGGAGMEFDPVSQACQKCPPGTQRDNTLKKCVLCPVGEYSGEGALTCTKCPAGQYSPSPGMPDQESITGVPGRHCLLCPRGSLALSDPQTAATAVDGQITDGATFCDACPPGFVQDADPLKPCIACAATSGPYSYRTGDATPENNVCVKIPAGYKLKLPTAVGVTPAVVANTEIEMCEKGRVSFWKTDALREPTDQYSCIACADLLPTSTYGHTYAPHEGMVACIPCAAGTIPYSTGTPGSQYTESCVTCPDGYYRDAYSKRSTCIKCGAGAEAGPTNQQECTLCPPGYYMNATMATANKNYCLPCSTNQFRATPGGTSCDLCPKGTDTQHTGNVECDACSQGYYNNQPGTNCDAAPAGTYTNSTGSFVFTPCPKGTFNSDTAGDSCMPCAAGRFSPTLGSKECKTCPAGTYSKAQSSRCLDCRAGYSSPAGSPACNPCKAGTYAPDPRSPQCRLCPKGFRCPTAGMQKAMACPKGTFSGKDGLRECTPCAVNTVSSGGGTAANPVAIVTCTKCAVGFNTRGLPGQTKCSPVRPQVRRLSLR